MNQGGETTEALLTRELLTCFPVDAARALEKLSAREIAELLQDEEPRVVAEVIRLMALPVARSAFAAMETGPAADIAAALPVPWAGSVLRSMPGTQREEVLGSLSGRFGSSVRRTLHFSAQTVGSLMDPMVPSMGPDVDVSFAISQLRERPEPRLECIYIVARDGRLLGAVRVAHLILASQETPMGDLMDTEIPALSTDADAPRLAAHPGWAQWRSLPVVNGEEVFMGAVSYHVIQRLLLDLPATSSNLVPLQVSLAELFWLGLTGITDGLARRVARNIEMTGAEHKGSLRPGMSTEQGNQ